MSDTNARFYVVPGPKQELPPVELLCQPICHLDFGSALVAALAVCETRWDVAATIWRFEHGPDAWFHRADVRGSIIVTRR